MSTANSVARSCAQPAARSVTARRGGSSWPSGLLRLYSFLDGLAAKFGSITWEDTPTIGADGVTPGDGPDLTSVPRGEGIVLAGRFKMTKAPDGITGDEQLFGPLYVRNGYLVAKLAGVEATHAHEWSVGDIVDIKMISVPSGIITVEDF